MNKENLPNLKKNYIYRLFYDILTLITPFITTPYVSRVLGADGIGIYSYSNSIITYFVLCASLGTLSYGAREIAQHRESKPEVSKLFWEIELMTFATSFFALLIWVIVIIFSNEYKIYFLATTPCLLATMFDISWLFTGLEKIKSIVIRNSFCRIISIICLFIFVNSKDDLVIYIIINSGVNLIGNLSMWTYLPSILVKVDFKTLRFKKHFKETFVYFIPTIATSVYTVLDKTLIGVITNNEYENGYYEQATKVIGIVKTLVFTSVNFIMTARMSYLFAKNAFDEIKEKIKKSMDIILFLAFGSMFGIIGISKRFVPMFFGDGYEPVVKQLYFMAPLIVIIGISNCLGSQYYTPSGKRAQSAKYIIAGSVTNLIANICLIPKLSAVGAIIGSILAELLITILYIKNSDNFINVKTIFQLSWKRVIAGVVMCGVILKIGQLTASVNLNSILQIAVQVITGVGIYSLILILMKDSAVNWIFQNFIKKIFKKQI